MKTKRWNLVNQQINEQNVAINEAIKLLKDGLTVAFPTETVYGLGADATNAEAVTSIFQAKGRPQDNPLIVHVATKQQLYALVSHVQPYAEQLIDAFTPGPITFVLPSNGICAPNVTAGLQTVAVRIPDHPVALQLLKNSNMPIAAPSANVSGKPSPTMADHVWGDLAGKIAGVLDGGATGIGVESTVVDCSGEIPIILRPGGVTIEQMKQVVKEVAMTEGLSDDKMKPLSPGMKYKHYAPSVPLWLVDGSLEKVQQIINREQQNSKRVGLLVKTEDAQKLEADQIISLGNTLPEIAANLYDRLRLFDKDEVDLIICTTYTEIGIGQAIMNRLRKAATVLID